jgi:sec-independent protein translocase protein TatB
MNFGFSGEMIFLFFLALILFGPRKLPEIGRQIGRFMNEFRRASNEFRSQIEAEINTLEAQKPQILPPVKSPVGSIASRIFNPPPVEATEPAAAVTAPPAEAEPAAPEPELAAAAPAGMAPPPETTPAKVAPDA